MGDHDDGECLLGSPSPGDDRRAWLKRNAPATATGACNANGPDDQLGDGAALERD